MDQGGMWTKLNQLHHFHSAGTPSRFQLGYSASPGNLF
uniref:Uncharacterized protein n=1 Tax=Anguilla anguilla TaxID=7936 RepID=A0A0E9U777_ANGAN